MVIYSIIILSVFVGAVLIPVSIAVTSYERQSEENKRLDNTPTDTFFMKG